MCQSNVEKEIWSVFRVAESLSDCTEDIFWYKRQKRECACTVTLSYRRSHQWGPGRADKGGDTGLPPLLVAGYYLLFPLSVPLQSTLHKGTRVIFGNKEFINVTSILPTTHWLPLLLRMKLDLLTVIDKALDDPVLTEVLAPSPHL